MISFAFLCIALMPVYIFNKNPREKLMTNVLLKHLILSLVVSFTPFLLSAAGENYYRLGREETMASAGLRLKWFKDCALRALPAMNVHSVKNNLTNERLEAYLPEELWLYDQFLGMWANQGSSIIIAKMALNTPDPIERIAGTLVFKDKFEEWKKNATPKWEGKDILAWLSLFSKMKVYPEPESVKTGSGISMQHYRTSGGEDYVELYVAASTKTPEERFVIMYKLGRGASADKAAKYILQSAQSLAIFPPKTSGNENSHLLTTSKSSKQKERSEEYEASRERVINNLKNLKDWWYVETDNFIIVANLKQKKMIEAMQVEIERSRLAYTSYFPVKTPLSAVSVVRAFEKRDDYKDYVGANGEWSIGMWIPMKKELAISPLENAQGNDRKKSMIATLYHEAFHQYIFYATNFKENSPWFNEGFAQYFEGLKFRGRNTFSVELREDDINQWKNGKQTDIERLLTLNYEQFYQADQRAANYSTAWAFTYFLCKGAPVMKDKQPYAEIPSKYYDAILGGKNTKEATDQALEGIDIKVLKQDFNDFWNNKTLIIKSRQYEGADAIQPKAGKNLETQQKVK